MHGSVIPLEFFVPVIFSASHDKESHYIIRQVNFSESGSLTIRLSEELAPWASR